MLFLTTYILCFTFFNTLDQFSCVELPAKEKKNINETEWSLPNIVNNLFYTLKLSHSKHNQKLKQYLKIHNFFVSITLQDHFNLKKIARLTKVDNKIDNNTQIFITHLNDLFIKDSNSDEETDDVYVTMFIDEFQKKLEDLKEVYGLNRNVNNFDVNKDVLQHLSKNDHNFENETKIKNSNGSRDNELWQPAKAFERSRRIFKGEKVRITRFPFMASVQFFMKFQCGSSIIKSDLVITSASCLQLAWNNGFFRENPSFLSVQIGSDIYQNGKYNIPILEIKFHPSYKPKTLSHNLALMRLKRRLDLHESDRVKKIEFDKNPSPLPNNTTGITIIGWGARSFQKVIQNPVKNPLSMAILEHYPFQFCQDIYTRTYVTDKNFCAGFYNRGGGACNHDAGGPGIVSGILMGVISFGSPVCGAPDAPTVLTKLGYYADWIMEIMKQPVHASNLRMITTTRIPYIYKKNEIPVPPGAFKLKPKPPKDRESNIEVPISPKDRHALRMKNLDKDRNFEQFLTTMFDSQQIDEYIDQFQAEIDAEYNQDNAEETNQSKIKSESIPEKLKTKLKSILKAKAKRMPKSKTKSKFETKYVNTIQNQDIDVETEKPAQSNQTKSIPQFNDTHNLVGDKTFFKDSNELERVIKTIIDNLQIPNFLEFRLSTSNKKNGRSLKGADQHPNSESNEYTSDTGITHKEDSIPSVLQRSNDEDESKVKDEIKTDEEGGGNDYENENNEEDYEDDINDEQHSDNYETGDSSVSERYHSSNEYDEDGYGGMSIQANIDNK